MKSVLEVKKEIAGSIAGYYPPEEAEAIARQLLEDISGMPYPEMILRTYKLSEKDSTVLEAFTARLLRREPLQQILGYAPFGDLTLKVTSKTLIPRPETEELCEKIIDRGWLKEVRTALDAGTGTGAIALFLKSREPQTVWHAIDLDPDTLSVAESNAKENGLPVFFHLMDMLRYDLDQTLDLIVSNPPYILTSEKEEMLPHVLDFEPHKALFAPDTDPIIFYRAVLEKMSPHLSEKGCIALELNPITADDVARLYETAGFVTEIEKDFYGKKRFLFAQRKS